MDYLKRVGFRIATLAALYAALVPSATAQQGPLRGLDRYGRRAHRSGDGNQLGCVRPPPDLRATLG